MTTFDIVDIIIIVIWMTGGFIIISQANRRTNSGNKTFINGKELKVKTLKLPFLSRQDDGLSSEFNGKSSKEDSNPFEV